MRTPLVATDVQRLTAGLSDPYPGGKQPTRRDAAPQHRHALPSSRRHRSDHSEGSTDGPADNRRHLAGILAAGHTCVERRIHRRGATVRTCDAVAGNCRGSGGPRGGPEVACRASLSGCASRPGWLSGRARWPTGWAWAVLRKGQRAGAAVLLHGPWARHTDAGWR